MIKITILAAVDENHGIGIDGRLPWHIPADLARFKSRILGKTLIIGRKTAESLPKGLPGRKLVVVSSSGDYSNVREAIASETKENEELIIARGGGIYLEAIEYATHAEITRVPGNWNCDAFMPKLNGRGWELTEVLNVDGLEIEKWSK